MLDQFPFKVDERFADGTMTSEIDPVRQAQYNDFIEIFSELNVPLLCLCGTYQMSRESPKFSLK